MRHRRGRYIYGPQLLLRVGSGEAGEAGGDLMGEAV